MRVACVAGFEGHYNVLSCTTESIECCVTITSQLWTLYSLAVICTPLMYTRKYRRVLRSATSGSSWCRWRSRDPTLPCTFQRLLYIFAFFNLPLFTINKPPFFASNSPFYSPPSMACGVQSLFWSNRPLRWAIKKNVYTLKFAELGDL